MLRNYRMKYSCTIEVTISIGDLIFEIPYYIVYSVPPATGYRPHPETRNPKPVTRTTGNCLSRLLAGATGNRLESK
jgi:hypothetical protein